MQISKKSWHYRLNYRVLRWFVANWQVEENIPKSLCGYFWHTVFVIIVGLLFGSVMLVIGAFIYAFIGVGYAWSYVTRQEARKTRREALKAARQKEETERRRVINERYDRGELSPDEYVALYYNRKLRKRQPREPGLFRSWLKARKEKVCPTLEFVDE